MTVTALEYVLGVTGFVTLALAIWALRDSLRERYVLRCARVNGLKWATVTGHIWRDLARVMASGVLCGAGIWLLLLPDDPSLPSLVAKHALMFMGWMMSGSVFADRITRERIRVHLRQL